jgi:hypothetical protein
MAKSKKNAAAVALDRPRSSEELRQNRLLKDRAATLFSVGQMPHNG